MYDFNNDITTVRQQTSNKLYNIGTNMCDVFNSS